MPLFAEIFPDSCLKTGEHGVRSRELPFQKIPHFSLHLVDFVEIEHTLSDDLFKYVSSHMTFEEIMKADMNIESMSG